MWVFCFVREPLCAGACACAGRALDEAADLNAFFNAGNQRMLARTASFCHGRAGHYDMCVSTILLLCAASRRQVAARPGSHLPQPRFKTRLLADPGTPGISPSGAVPCTRKCRMAPHCACCVP